MKKASLLCGLLLVTLWAQGCISVHSDKRTVPSRPPAPKPVPPAPPAPEPEDMTIKEIAAVSTLSSENRRREFYTTFAGRTDLSPRAQVYLINTIFKRISSENARTAILKVLIANPSFTTDSEKAILDRLRYISSENSRAEILRRLSER